MIPNYLSLYFRVPDFKPVKPTTNWLKWQNHVTKILYLATSLLLKFTIALSHINKTFRWKVWSLQGGNTNASDAPLLV